MLEVTGVVSYDRPSEEDRTAAPSLIYRGWVRKVRTS